MANKVVFTKIPLIEAILDVRAINDPKIPQETFEKYYSEISSEYTVKTVNTLMQASVAMKPGEPTKMDSSSSPNGFVFKTSDNSKVIQFRKDGFTFNMTNLAYKDWESFSGEAKKHFQKYIEIIKPQLFNRIALRYINIINIPLPFKDFREYILTAPDIAPNLPQLLTELFMRIVIPDDKKENVAIISEGIDISRMKPDVALLPFIFDIDVFRQMNFEPNTELVWQKFKSIRNYRSEIFFNSLTEKALNLFK